MGKSETTLVMVQRHIRDGARQIARQRERVDRMRINQRPTEMAETLLVGFEDLQRQHKAHLLRLEGGNN